MKTLKSFGCLFILFSMIFIQSSSAQDRSKQVQVTIRQQDPYGSYLTDNDGKSLYLFLKDSNGTSACYNQCAVAWPPLITKDKKIKGGKGVQASLLGTVERKDGSLQVTYNGHPLYYYEDDKNPGDVEGQDKDEFGEEWYLVKPNGAKMGDVEEK
ncbi:MAG TPA: hypothetical protein VFX43_00805 [Chitinophagaceae bacterium]|nr:hypothetical protein [Chitinophagaceae bacterium]